MLPIKQIRENSTAVIAGLSKRNFDASKIVEEILHCDSEQRRLQQSVEEAQATVNRESKSIGTLMQQGKRDEAEAMKLKVSELKESLKREQSERESLAERLHSLLVQLPNVPDESVPEGRSAADNEIVRNGGAMPKLPENALPHWELASRLGMIDFELGVKLTGSGFPLFVGAGARLERGLINHFLDFNTQAGYKEVMPPILVSEASAFATGQLPDKEGQMYYVAQDNLYLIPTAEVPVTNIFRDSILEESELPTKLTAYTPCFRREAGSYGKDVRGLNRLHQFDKVEIVCISHPNRSFALLDEMVKHVEALLSTLELPYRIVKLCGGDMGFTSALTFDFEVYSAAQNRWLEVSSVSNFRDFQANRLQLRYRSAEDRKINLAHTLNGSSIALPRIVAALLENNQTTSGVRIPKALQEWMGCQELIWE